MGGLRFSLIMLTFFSVKFQLNRSEILTSNEKNGQFYEHFQVISDQKQVEELATKYAEFKKTSGSIKSFISSKLKMGKSICQQSKQVKIAFCAQVSQMEYYGFEFDFEKHENYDCKTQKFFVRSIATTETDNFELSMFSCPYIQYTDFKSNKKILWIYQYHISRGKMQDSAFVFFNKIPEKKVYPQKFVTNMEIKSLKPYSRLKMEEVTSPLQWLVPYNSVVTMKRMADNYIRMKQIVAPYQKFIRLIFSINICGLRQSHKIYVCRQMIQFLYDRILDLESFCEQKCRNYSVSLYDEEKLGLQSSKKIFAFHCPTMSLLQQPSETNLGHFYVASFAQINTVMSFYRINERGRMLKPKIYYDKVNTSPIIEDNRRTKLLLYSSQSQQICEARNELLKKIEDKLNKIRDSNPKARMKIQNRNSKFSSLNIQLITNKRLVDNFLIFFSKTKRTKLMYQKFKNLYESSNICQLSTQQKFNLCFNILEGDKYKHNKINRLQTKMQLCQRKVVSLNAYEAENLETDIFSMWQCPNYANSGRKYFIGKSYKNNVIIVFVSVEMLDKNIFKAGYSFNEIYADAAVIFIEK